MWLLLFAGYGPVNASSRRQLVPDNGLLNLGLQHLRAILQSFVKRGDEANVVLAVVKIVDAALSCGPFIQLRCVVEAFRKLFKLRTISCRPG